MENSKIFQEETKNSSDTPERAPTKGDLVFLIESKQVTCLECYDKYYSGQTTRKFGHPGCCQSIHCRSSSGTTQTFTLMAEYQIEDSGETKHECLFCLEEDVKVTNVFPFKEPKPHQCKNKGRHLSELKDTVLTTTEAFSKEAMPECLKYLKTYFSVYFSGSSSILERHLCSLNFDWTNQNQTISEKTRNQAILCLNTLISSEMPWFLTAPEFLLNISSENRSLLLENLRKKLIYLTKSNSEAIETNLLRMARQTKESAELNILALFLSKKSRFTMFSQCIEVFITLDSDFKPVLRLIFLEILEMSDFEFEGLDSELREEIALALPNIVTPMGSKDYFTDIYVYTAELSKFINIFPKNDLNEAIPNEEQLIGVADKLHFLIKQVVYGDMSTVVFLEDCNKTLLLLRNLLGIQHSINYSTGTSSALSSAQKAKLLYKTPLVTTLLTTAQILKEEYYRTSYFKRNFPIFESIFSEIFSVMHELAKDSYDIALLFALNQFTLLDFKWPSKTIQNQFEILFISIITYLKGFSIESGYKRHINNILTETFLETYRSLRREEDKTPRKLEIKEEKVRISTKKVIIYLLLNQYFPGETESKDLKEVNQTFARMHLSLDYRLKCFVLPLIEFDLTEALAPETDLDKQVNPILFKKISKLVQTENLSDLDKMALMRYFLVSGTKIQNNHMTINLFDNLISCLPGENKYKTELNINYSGFSVDLNVAFTREKQDFLSKYVKALKIYFEKDFDLKISLTLLKEIVPSLKELANELDFNQDKEVFSLYETVVDRLNSSQNVKFESESESCFLEDILDFKEEGENLIFKHKIAKDTKKAISDILTVKDSKILAKPAKPNRIVEIIKYKDEVQTIRSTNILLARLDLPEMSNVQLVSELLPSLVAPTQKFRMQPSQFKDKLNRTSTILLMAFIQLSNTSNSPTYKEIFQVYYEIATNMVRFFREAVEGNNMEIKRILAEEKIKLSLESTIAGKLEVWKNKIEMVFLELVRYFSQTFTFETVFDSLAKYKVEEDSRVRFIASILELISEIVEGNSNESIALFSQYYFAVVQHRMKGGKNYEIITKYEDLCLDFYFEINANKTTRDFNETYLDNGRLVRRITELKQIYFIDEILSDDKKNKAKRLVKAYFSEENIYYTEFKAVFQAFIYLRYCINFNFKKEEDQDLPILVELLENISKKVEISVDDKLKEVFFMANWDFSMLSKKHVKTFVESVDRSSIAAKNKDLVNYALHFRDEIESDKENSASIWKKTVEVFDTKWLILLCLLLNLGEIYIMVENADAETRQLVGTGKTAFTQLLVIQFVAAMLIVLLWLLSKFNKLFNLALMRYRAKNNVNKGQETSKERLYVTIIVLLSSIESVSGVLVVLTSILALSFDSLYWAASLQLLCFINFSKNLSNIVRAIQLRGKQLLLISLFLLGSLFISGLLTFNYMKGLFQTEDGDMLCTTLGHCLASQFDYGFRMGGGMGDSMPVQEWRSDRFWSKFFYSMLHFVLFPVIMLNVVAGIIIDTFADLREQAAELEEDINTICLVCGGSKDEINKDEGSYKVHVTEKHKVLNYMLFIKYILDRDEKYLDYCETVVRKQLEKGEINWFPINDEDIEFKLLGLENRLKIDLTKKITDNLEKTVTEKVDEAKKSIESKLSGLENKLKTDLTKKIADSLEKTVTQKVDEAKKSIERKVAVKREEGTKKINNKSLVEAQNKTIKGILDILGDPLELEGNKQLIFKQKQC